MSVDHDLSSEIATAILARKEEKRNLKGLKEVVLLVAPLVNEISD